MVGEEVQRGVFLLYVVQERRTVFSWIGKCRPADFQNGETVFEVLGSYNVQLVKLLHSSAPRPGIRFPAVVRLVQIRFIPDFPILYAHMVPVSPAFVVVADDMLADAGPLLIVLGRIDAVLFCLMLNALPKSEEGFGASFQHILEHYVAVSEIVRPGIVDVGIEIRENLVNVYAVAAVFGSQGRVVRPGVWNAEGSVRFHCGVDGTVVCRIHRFEGSEDACRAEPHHCLGGNKERYEYGVYHSLIKRCSMIWLGVKVVIF